MATKQQSKPLPRPLNPKLTKPFWEATKRGELLLPLCKTCDSVFWYPREDCPRCMSPDVGWTKSGGRGRVHTFTIVRQPAHPAFLQDVPYIWAIVQLDEGPRMISNVINCPVENVYIDMPVKAIFEELDSDFSLVKFEPA